jgi:hypothetical protein
VCSIYRRPVCGNGEGAINHALAVNVGALREALYPKSITPTASSMSSRSEWQLRLSDEQIGALILTFR